MSLFSQIKKKINKNKLEISVIGLGYVGLPVAYSFSKKFKVIGFDINTYRVKQLKKNNDINKSISNQDLKNSKIKFSSDFRDMKNSEILIITTPTPITFSKNPDLSFIFKALQFIIKLGIKNKFIILESTVYPGASENKFIKYLEKSTGLLVNNDFFYGYSPERINPGDKTHTFNNISKIVSGSNKKTCEIVYQVYKKVVSKLYKASSILSAETSKLIENSQRDLNVAFVNEISIICDKLNIKSSEVLKLASTKWNFLNFSPGLVGGHCIGVDPYYLFYSSKKLGYKPETLLAGRALNESYPKFLVKKFLSYFKKKKIKVLLMGATYKANCNDLRNSKSIEIFHILKKKNCEVHFFDPNVEKRNIGKIQFLKKPKRNFYDGIIISVDHMVFKKIGYNKIKKYGKKDCKVFDVKNLFQNQPGLIYL
jgi:UDP-N-acetyl-D-glucosamine/UDP-N-acetyl-D-galactosamine dehydrogenase